MDYCEYRFKKRPPFLEGCFHWKERGYSFASSPNVALLAPEALRSADPWVRLAAALEFAKKGDHSHVSDLTDLVQDESVDPTLAGGILDLIADAGARSDLEFLARLMLEGADFVKIEAVRSARWAGVLWLIPYMANVIESTPRRADRDTVEAAISALLDPLSGSELSFFDCSDSPRTYAERVARRVDELASRAGTDEAVAFAGELIDMRKLILHMQARLTAPAEDLWGDFLLLRHKFEAYTGADCSKFYRNGDFRPLSARVVVEDFIRANPDLNFQVGHRYFFMHELSGKGCRADR